MTARTWRRAFPRPAYPPDIRGLTAPEAAARLRLHGPNVVVPEPARGGTLRVLAGALVDPMALLLVAAAVVYFTVGERTDAIVALIALIPIVGVNVVLEWRTEHALAAVARLAAPTARVLRDGAEQIIAARDIVPGDTVAVQEGDVIPADGVVTHGTQLEVDESALTGESLPVRKDVVDHARLLAGTAVLGGRASMLVDRTGASTEYGALARSVVTAADPQSPLQRAIRRLVLQLGGIALVVCAGVLAVALLRGEPFAAALIASVSLAMAAVPEELPMVFTLYLGLGAWRLARGNALVRRLARVETLGSTTVICVDKTGTLTTGRVELARVVAMPDTDERTVLDAAVRASEPDPFDPLDRAIVRAAERAGVDVRALHMAPLVRDHAFAAAHPMVTHAWGTGDGITVAAKGATETLLASTRASTGEQAWLRDAMAREAARGARVLAVAAGAGRPEADRAGDEAALHPLGLVVFEDPVREDAGTALAKCRRAGIRVIMLTGDHPATAAAIAHELGFPPDAVSTGADIDAAPDDALIARVRGTSVFARVRPEHKLRLVRALRASGEVVAMTGDGTNDAPALREADVGIAMGRRGTEVARAAASLVLLDDSFATIERSVEDGRRIFDNLRAAFVYLIAFHVPLVLLALVIPAVSAPLLLLPVHLVWLELIVHPTSALVFEARPAAPDVMERPPRRPGDEMFTSGELAFAAARGASLTVAVVVLYLAGLATLAEEGARSVALVALVTGQATLVITELGRARDAIARPQPVLLAVLAATFVSVIAIVTIPAFADLFHVGPVDALGWAVALSSGALGAVALEPLRRLAGAEGRPGPRSGRSGTVRRAAAG